MLKFTRFLEVNRWQQQNLQQKSTNWIADSLSVSVRPKKKKKKMEGKEGCEMLEKVYRPLGSSAETDRRLKFKS